MSLRRNVMAAAALVAVVGVLFGVKASAGSIYMANEDGSTTVAKGKVVDGSAYLAGNTVLVQGTVNGDVYCAGNTVRVDGTVNGDVLCAGNTVTVSGTVNGDVRAAGATVTLGGKISGNASVAGSDIIADASLKLGGDLTGGAATLTVDGVIGRDMTVGAGDLLLNGRVGRDVMTGLDTVTFGTDATVGGNFNYSANKEFDIPENTVAGKTDFTMIDDEEMQQTDGFGSAILWSLSVAVLAFLGAFAMPKQTRALGEVSWGNFAAALGLGLAVAILTPVVAVILLITGVGSIVAYALLLAWLLVMALSPVGIAYFVGTKVYGKNSNHVLLRSLVGAVILFIVLLIPVVNVPAFFVMLFAGVGLFLLRIPSLYSGNNAYNVPGATPASKNKVSKKASA